MARWRPGTRNRMRDAALELFAEHGYERTTAAQIAAAAGVTERTFFRHFPDKEEVLFDEDAELLTLLREDLLRAMGGAGSIDAGAAARAAVRGLAQHFDGDHARHRQRANVLARSPSLQARQLLKQHAWSEVLVHELAAQGVPTRTAAAAVGVAATGLQLAYGEWVGRARPGPLVALLDAYDAEIDRATGGT